jgi:hypothetical protein
MNDVLVFAIVSGPKSHNVTGNEPVSLFRWKQEGGQHNLLGLSEEASL